MTSGAARLIAVFSKARVSCYGELYVQPWVKTVMVTLCNSNYIGYSLDFANF